MKREIKFKFIIDNKELSKSYTLSELMCKEECDILCDMESCSCKLNESNNHCECNSKYEESEITGKIQFIGLKDKNGKEIYEGDIFEVAGNKKYEVKFCEGAESNHEWYGGTFILYLNEDVFFPFDEYAMEHGKVIGNINQK